MGDKVRLKKYKIEIWKKRKWEGTKRETIGSQERIVLRDNKGRFVKVISKVQEKTYGSGVYKVGIVNGKIVTRQKIASRNVQWYERKKEVLSKSPIFRTSYVLNDIPFRGNVYYGFRIVAFSRNQKMLEKLKPKLKDRLIEFIEQCLKYRKDEFWFNMYWGYESPKQTNVMSVEMNKYYLMWQKRHGSIVKEERHSLMDLI